MKKNDSKKVKTFAEDLRVWLNFFRNQSYIFEEEPGLVLQQAANLPKNSPLSSYAREFLQANPRMWIELRDRLSHSRDTARLSTFRKHKAWVLCVASIPKDNIIASSDHDGKIKIWNSITGEEVVSLSEHKQAVDIVRETFDGRFLISAGLDGTIKMWETEYWTLVKSWEMGQPIYDLKISPKKNKIAFTHAGGEMGILDLDSGEVRWLKTESWIQITSVSFSLDGFSVIAGCNDGLIAVLDITTGGLRRILKKHTNTIMTLTISNDGRILASGGKDAKIILWNIETGEEIFALEGHSDLISQILISSDDRWLFSASFDETIKIWSLESKKIVNTVRGHGDRIESLAISADEKYLISGGDDRSVIIWDLKRLKQPDPDVKNEIGHSNIISTTKVSQDGRYIISGSWDQTLITWESATCRPIRVFKGHQDKISAVAISPDGERIVSGSRDKSIIIWELSTGRILKTLRFKYDPGWINALVLNYTGTILFSGTEFGILRIWNMKKLKKWYDISIDPEFMGIRTIALTPDNSCVIIGGFGQDRMYEGPYPEKDGLVAIYFLDRKTLRKIGISKKESEKELEWPVDTIFRDHIGTVSDLVVYPDGSWFISIAWDGKIIKRSRTSDKPSLQWKGDSAQLYVITVTPDRKWIFSGGRDKVLKIWSTDSGEHIGSFYCGGEVRACSVWMHEEALFAVAGDSVGKLYFLKIHNPKMTNTD